MNDFVETENSAKDEAPLDKSRLSMRKGAMGHWGKASGQTFSWELGKIINKSNMPKLGNELRALDFRNERDHIIIESRNVNRPQTEPWIIAQMSALS